MLDVETLKFQVQQLLCLCFSTMFAKGQMQNSFFKEIKASSKAFRRWMILICECCRVWFCKIMSALSLCCCSLLAVRRVGRYTTAGEQERTEPLNLETRTPALTNAASVPLWRTRASRNTQSNHCSKTRCWWPLWIERERLAKSALADLSVTTSPSYCLPRVTSR